MLKLGNHWIELMELSDIVFLGLALALICNLLICLLFGIRHYLERKLGMQQLNQVLKFLLVYILVFMPFITVILLYKNTYSYIGPYNGDDGINTIWITKSDSISFSTTHGNHWIFFLILFVWLVGVVFCGLKSFITNKKVLRRVKQFSVPCTDPDMIHLLNERKSILDIKGNIKIWVSNVVDIPFVTGILKPDVFLPEASLNSEKFQLVLEHELIHCKKKDYLYRRILFWISALYWYNPLLYAMAEYYVEINEIACDEVVLENRTKKERLCYAEMLVNFQNQDNILSNAVSLTGHSESQLERRLENMLRKKGKAGKATCVVLTLLFILASPVTTFAAAKGVSDMQDAIVDMVTDEIEETMILGNTLQEEIDTDTMEYMEQTISETLVQARGSTAIDVVVKGKSKVSLGNISVEANTDIDMALKADPTTSSFRAGYINSSGIRTYITSSNGKINHEFSIANAGTYELFIEGLTTNTFNVTGGITVY